MKGRRTAWIALLILLVGLGGFTYGFLCNQSKLPAYGLARRAFDWSRQQPQLRKIYYLLRGIDIDPDRRLRGSWHRLGEADQGPPCGDQTRRSQQELQALGYLSGYKPASGPGGVTIYLAERACPGLNLITSGHAQEAILMDMEGKVLHRWRYEFGDAFPDYRGLEGRIRINQFYRDFWRRCYLYPNGDLLAIYDGFGMIKLDRDSHLIWAVEGGCHHDLFVCEDGLIYVLTRELKMLPDLNPSHPVLEDFITVLDPDGHLIRKVSVPEAFCKSSFASFLDRRPDIDDMLHTNTVEVLDGSLAGISPIFRRGNVLISSRHIDTIAIVDMDQEKVVWALSGQWLAQHEPALLPNGHILLLDNRGHHGMSKVIEFDPFTQQILWSYEGTPQNGFFTESSGTTHRLPNGNTLIVESNSGRAFEVTRQKEIVWEYVNTERAGENRELIATLFDVVRLDPDYASSWLSPDR